MKNNNTNERNEMKITMTHNFRVYKHANGSYDAFANFTSLKEAVGYMRRWNPNQMHNWFIVDEHTGTRFQMNQQDKLVVTYSGLGVLATKKVSE